MVLKVLDCFTNGRELKARWQILKIIEDSLLDASLKV